MVIGVQWYNYISCERHDIPIQIVDIRARGLIIENPINFGQDLTADDDLSKNSTVGVFPDLNSEAWESCQFNSDFPELDRL